MADATGWQAREDGQVATDGASMIGYLGLLQRAAALRLMSAVRGSL